MPRYMQVTPTFNPMSYEERIKPLEQYKQEYDKQMDTLDEQGMLADAIGGLIDPNQDPELAQIYNNFSNTMNNVAGELLRTGKLGETRRGLRELRTAYANQLVPIQTAYNDRAQAAKEFREAKLKDQTLIGTDPLTHSLKDFMKGKNPNDKVVSGNTLYSMALADTKAASGREFRETAWRLDKNLGSQFFSRIQKEGWSQDEVVQALAGLTGSEDKQISEDATKLMNYLADAHNRIHSLAGIDELKDAANIKEADNYILEGLITGVGYKQADDQRAYNPKFWDGVGGQKPTKTSPILTYGTRPLVYINDKVEDETELAQILSDLKMKKVNVDTTTDRTVTDYSMVLKDKEGNPIPLSQWNQPTYSKETYGDRIYDIAKGLGEVPKEMTKEEYINGLRTASEEDFQQKIDNISQRIRENVQLYTEVYSNFTDHKMFAEAANRKNAGNYENGKLKSKAVSYIHNSKGDSVEKLPEDGTYDLPIRKENRKGIRFAGNDGKTYYVDPQAFIEAPVTAVDSQGNIYPTVSLPEAYTIYYAALNTKNNTIATAYREAIMNALAAYNTNQVQVPAHSSSAINIIKGE